MAGAVSTSIDAQIPPVAAPTSSVASDTRGKHRFLAELKRLEQETRYLEDAFPCKATNPTQEELEELEKIEKASIVCQELLPKVETRPDPLIPVTNGPANPSWDRWFEGPQESQGCKCWIL